MSESSHNFSWTCWPATPMSSTANPCHRGCQKSRSKTSESCNKPFCLRSAFNFSYGDTVASESNSNRTSFLDQITNFGWKVGNICATSCKHNQATELYWIEIRFRFQKLHISVRYCSFPRMRYFCCLAAIWFPNVNPTLSSQLIQKRVKPSTTKPQT